MSLRYTPMKRVGRRGLETEAIRRGVWPRVLRRAKMRCEGCGAGDVPLQWSHLFGRSGTGAGLGAWAHTEHLTAALCLHCHQSIDRDLDPILRNALRWRAVTYFQMAYPTRGCHLYRDLDAMDSVRTLVRFLEGQGVEP